MSFKSSTGARNALLAELKDQLDGGFVYIYDNSAATPSSPNDAVPGGAVLLCIISNNGTATGITFAAPADGIMLKEPSEVWSGENLASGTAAWYRVVADGDTGLESTTDVRVQGSIGTVNADLLLADTFLTIEEEQRIDYFAIGLPASIS